MKKCIIFITALIYSFLGVNMPFAGTWTQKAYLGDNLGDWYSNGAVGFAIGSKGYIGTGYNGTEYKDFWEYDSVGHRRPISEGQREIMPSISPSVQRVT
jgi:hypothetical protein